MFTALGVEEIFKVTSEDMVDNAPLLMTNDQVKGFHQASKEIVFVPRFDVFHSLSFDTIYTVFSQFHVVRFRDIVLLGLHQVQIHDHHVLF
jgi:hypothetical protein